jgi:hypothetical protein
MLQLYNMEGLRSPEHHESSPDRILLEQARAAACEMLYSPDQFSREIAEKILGKIDIKERVDSLFAHADDVTVYQEYKKLGIFVVRDAKAKFDYADPSTGFSLRKGERYLDLHLPPVPQALRSREAVTASLGLIQQYIDAQGLQPKYLMGVTYERMARLAESRFGFSVTYPNPHSLPDDVVRGVQRVYEGFTEAGMNGAAIGLPAIVFQEITPKVERSTSRTQPLGNLVVGKLVQH